MRTAGWFALTVASGMSWLLSRGQPDDTQDPGRKENLELPSDAPWEGAEESLASRVCFYGQTLESEGFFFVVDRGRSMASSGKLERVKREIINGLSAFSPRTQFALAFFGKEVSKFPASGQPASATLPMKNSAAAWVESIRGDFGTSILDGFRAALAFANRSSVEKKIVIYVGDSGAFYGSTSEARRLVEAITILNTQRVRIDCIGAVGEDRGGFLKELAAANGGLYRRAVECSGAAGEAAACTRQQR